MVATPRLGHDSPDCQHLDGHCADHPRVKRDPFARLAGAATRDEQDLQVARVMLGARAVATPASPVPAPARPAAGRLRFRGPLRGPRPPGMECVQPVLYVSDRGERVTSRCNAHRAKQCAPCAARYRYRVKRLVHDGIDTLAARGRRTGMLTFTAPGDPGHSSANWVGGPYGEPNCRCARALTDPGLWNASAGRRWNHLRTVLRRRYPDLDFHRAAEFQDGKRGGQARMLLHLHVTVAYTGTLDLQWIRDRAIDAGFGCGVDWLPEVKPGYVAKYVTKSLDDMRDAPWSESSCVTGEIVPAATPRLRTWSCSQSWPVTMRVITETNRRQAAAWALGLRALGEPAAVGERVAEQREPAVAGEPPPPS